MEVIKKMSEEFICEICGISEHDEQEKKEENKLIAEEIFDLQHFRELKKVDHVEGKSKDVCDAVVGAVWCCLNYGNESAKAKHTFEEAQAVVSANARRDLNRRALFSVDLFISRKWK
jgi:hypothetical protein